MSNEFIHPENEININNCLLTGINNIFSRIISDTGEFNQFDSVSFEIPHLLPNFYTKDEINSFYFFKLISSSGQMNIAIEKEWGELSHVFYYCDYVNGAWVIDFSKNILCNFSFLNECGYSIYNDTTSRERVGWTENIFDERFVERWTIDSVSKNGVKALEFTKNRIILNKIDSIQYYKKGRFFYSSLDSLQIFETIAISEGKIILKQNNDEELIYGYVED